MPSPDRVLSARTRFELDSLVALGLGVLFLGTGVAKIVGVDFIVATFGGWPYPMWMLFALGVVEIAAAVLTVIPTTRLIGAGTLAAIMLGAVSYHLSRAEFEFVALPAVLLVMSTGLAALQVVERANRPEPLRPHDVEPSEARS